LIYRSLAGHQCTAKQSKADNAPSLWLNPRLSNFFHGTLMTDKIRTEADRKRAPKPVLPNGVTMPVSRGQKRSLERGTATRNKKNSGKRAKKGG
jgi:hypothetical protein